MPAQPISIPATKIACQTPSIHLPIHLPIPRCYTIPFKFRSSSSSSAFVWRCICRLSARFHPPFPHAVKQRRYFVPNGVSCPQSNPLWDRSVLLLCSGELLLGAEGLVALLRKFLSKLLFSFENLRIISLKLNGNIPAS